MNLSRRQFLKGAGAAAALTLAPAFAFAEESKTLRTTGADERITDELLEVRELPEPPAVWRDAVDKANPMKTIYTGAYRVPVTVSETVEREAVVYIGEGFTMTQSIVFIVPQSGMRAEECLVSAGWTKLADEHGLVVMALQPGDEPYDTSAEGSDFAFLKAMVARGGQRTHWFMPKGRAYIAGYGDGAALMLRYAAATITTWAGIACFGSTDLDPATLGLKLSVPAWLYTDDLDATRPLTELLCQVNGCTSEKLSSEAADEIYLPSQKTNGLLLNEQPVSQVRVSLVGDPDACNTTRTNDVWAFFSNYTRETGYGKKAIRVAREVEDWGAERRSLELDGITRTWIEYVPTTLRCTSEGKVPLMLVLHGNALNGEYFVERSQYIRMAEEKGFIIVFPNGSIGKVLAPTWNISSDPESWDDIGFIRAMIDDVCARQPVDTSRIYCYGHSLGGMFTQCLCSRLDGLFAAASGTGCATDLDGMANISALTHTTKTPMYVIMGENDQWDGSMGSDAANWYIDYWTRYNETASEPSSYRNGRYACYEWKDADGVAMVKYAIVDGMPHTTTLDIGLEQYGWMSRFSRRADGSVGVQDGFYVPENQESGATGGRD